MLYVYLFKNKIYAHIVSMLFTFVSICCTILFASILVPNTDIINDVGLIRMLTVQTDRCIIAEKHPAFKDDILKTVNFQ